MNGLFKYTRLLALELINRGIATSIEEVERQLANGYSTVSDPDLRKGIGVYLRSMERLGAITNTGGELRLTHLGRELIKKETPEALHAAIANHEARATRTVSRSAVAR